jgi:hypothetical protein
MFDEEAEVPVFRAVRFAPVVFGLVGAGGGVCLAMLYRQDPLARAHIDLDDSLPFFLAGTIVGSLFGCLVSAICNYWPRLVRWAGMSSILLLGAAFTAPLGWIVGDSAAERIPREGMIGGAVVGAIPGCVAGIIQLALDRMQPRIELQPMDLARSGYPGREGVIRSGDNVCRENTRLEQEHRTRRCS